METTKIQDYLKGTKKHAAWDETVKLAKRARVHDMGDFPDELIGERRPGESDAVQAYRRIIFKEVTKQVMTRIRTELNKIRKSKDWSVVYDESKFPNLAKTHSSGTLKDYCEYRFPNFTSVTNWTFSVLLRKYLTDANAVIFVRPLTTEIPTNELVSPYPFVYDSERVLEYVSGSHAILQEKKKSNGKDAAIYVVTTDKYERYEKNANGDYVVVDTYNHKLGYLPCFKIQAEVKDVIDEQFVNESRIEGVFARLDEALREYSDLQAAKVQHMYPQRWEYSTQECATCRGTGKTLVGEITGNCNDCSGNGRRLLTPFQTIQVAAPGPGEPAAPSVPAGYITMDTEIIKLQEESIKNHTYLALSAINMEYLSQAPLNQSGTAKEVDRDSLDTFVNSVAEDIVSMMDSIYQFTCDIRYSDLIASSDERKKLLPQINVPDTFGFGSSTLLLAEVKAGEESKLHPSLRVQQQLDYTRKRYSGNKTIVAEVELICALDPLPGIALDEKSSMLMNKGITEVNYVLSCNITAFVRRAMRADKNFAEKDFDKQLEVVIKYAEEEVKKNSVASKVVEMANDNEFEEGGG